MALKAVFLGLKGVIINDESIHQKLINDLLVQENLRADEYDFQRYCVGRSDRDCLRELLKCRGRIVTEDYLTKLIAKKAQAYQKEIADLKLSVIDGLTEFLHGLQQQNIPAILVTSALKAEATEIIERLDLSSYFKEIVAAEDITNSKPDPELYQVAINKLNLQPSECIAVEANYPGIAAAKQAGILAIAISHLHPLHMLQRRASFTVDYFEDIDLERINKLLSSTSEK